MVKRLPKGSDAVLFGVCYTCLASDSSIPIPVYHTPTKELAMSPKLNAKP